MLKNYILHICIIIPKTLKKHIFHDGRYSLKYIFRWIFTLKICHLVELNFVAKVKFYNINFGTFASNSTKIFYWGLKKNSWIIYIYVRH